MSSGVARPSCADRRHLERLLLHALGSILSYMWARGCPRLPRDCLILPETVPNVGRQLRAQILSCAWARGYPDRVPKSAQVCPRTCPKMCEFRAAEGSPKPACRWPAQGGRRPQGCSRLRCRSWRGSLPPEACAPRGRCHC